MPQDFIECHTMPYRMVKNATGFHKMPHIARECHILPENATGWLRMPQDG
jgi:hypothetical protein